MLQLRKSIHLDSLRQPFKKAIVTAAQLGAEAVEINGLGEVRASNLSRTGIRQIKKMLSDLNLSVAAIYFPTQSGYGDLNRLDQRIDGTKATLKLAYDLGCRVVVNRLGQIPDQVQDPVWSTMVQALMDIGNFSQRAGAWLAARTGSESGEVLKGFIDALPPQCLMVDFDPAALVINRFSASEAMEALSEHVISFRARDAVVDLSLGRGVEVQLGRGSVDWPGLLGALEEKQYQGFLTVERQSAEDPVRECGEALQYLTNLFR